MSKPELSKIWNFNSIVPAPNRKCAHEMIIEYGRSHPESLAIDSWDGRISYGKLDDVSTCLAHHLKDLGVGPQTLVPLCFEKSMWAVVSMLAVLKAEGAFVLLDCSQPEVRLRTIVQQCRTEFMCVSKANEQLGSRLGKGLVVSERYLADCHTQSRAALPLTQEYNPDLTMYVCFTSGSTGAPKGVVVTHSNFTTALQYQLPHLDLSENVRVFDFASYSFDVAVHNAMATLAVGGCLCIPPGDNRMQNLNESLKSTKAAMVNLTPSVARMLKPETLPDLKTLILLGETANPLDMKRLSERIKVINTYGPAECTPISTVNFDSSLHSHAARIGTGVGCTTWIVDPDNHDKLAPLGAIGELVLEGPILARGYLGDPEKTAAAFINDPPWLLQGCDGHPGRQGRIYKTGDLVQYNEDGSLSFIGRKDTQTKIRGQRLELSEVEYHVQLCLPSASQVVAEVVEPEERRENSMLAVFLQMQGEEGRDDGSTGSSETNDGLEVANISPAVTQDLLGRLPKYMVPSVYFRVSRMPVTATGKTDRKTLRQMVSRLSLKQLAALRTAPQDEKQKPETEAQMKLRDLWAHVLDLEAESIGLNDSFFQLGGDSISAIHLATAARERGISLSVADIFHNPVLSDQASIQGAVVTSSSPLKPFALLASRIDVEELQKTLATACSLDCLQVEDSYPCTQLQEGLISLTMKQTGSYTFRSIVQLSENTDINRFRDAWSLVAKATTPLRTRIIHHDQLGLLQVVTNEAINWKHAGNLERYLSDDAAISMGLGTALSRYALIGENETRPKYFVWTVHHALCDGWSLPRMIALVVRTYLDASSASLPRPGFNTFIQHIQDVNPDTEKYWSDYFANGTYTHFPPLPPAIQETHANVTVEESYEVTLEMRHGITPTTLIRAALALTIGSYTGSTDVVFGTTVSGRTAAIDGIEDILGPTIATVPIRLQIQREVPVLEFLQQVQRNTTEMIAHEQFGLQKIAKINDDCRSACNFNTFLVVQPPEEDAAIPETAEFSTWSMAPGSEHQFTTYALTLQCYVLPGRFVCKANTDTAVLDRWKLELFLKQLSNNVYRLATVPLTLAMGEVSTLQTGEQSILASWNGVVPNASNHCIHDLISEQVHLRPDALALHSWDGKLTYRELDGLSTRLALHLAQLGVGPEIVVPLYFEKSMWTIVAMLAVLKAGGAFLLLDTTLPNGRIRGLCQKVKASIAVMSAHCYSQMSSVVSKAVILDKTFLKDLTPQGSIQSPTPANAAYVIFTSGSTGEPKGCIIDHQAYCSAAPIHQATMGHSPETRALQFASYTFAGAIIESLMVLIHGGCITIPSEEQRKTDLAGAIRQYSCNWAFLTATALAALHPKEVPSLKTLCVGGEPIKSSQIQLWAPSLDLRQTYGSSELCGIISSKVLDITLTTMDVGKIISSAWWIVNPADVNQLQPIGAPGELIVEGANIGREYIGDPEKTAQAFIETPFWRPMFGSCHPTSRFYKTGDLAVYQKDGSILLLGRKDRQVKLRGQRIELGEIEHQICLNAPGIDKAVVELVDPLEANMETSLVCFFTAKSTATKVSTPSTSNLVLPESLPTLKALQEKLETVLPYYMIPMFYIPLSALPLTTTGKTDRKRLHKIAAELSPAQLDSLRTALEDEKHQPQTAMERKMRDLWASVLGRDAESIGRNDSFFRLGGDSVTAIHLVGAAHHAGIRLGVADIFQHTTLERVAANALYDATRSEIPPIRPFSTLESSAYAHVMLAAASFTSHDNIEDIHPLTTFQLGCLEEGLKYPRQSFNHIFLNFGPDVSSRLLESSCYQLIQLCLTLRSIFVSSQGTLWQVVLKQVPSPFKVVQTSLDLDTTSTDICCQDLLKGLKLGKSPTLFTLIHSKGQGSRLVIRLSHAQYDGISLSLMVATLLSLYQQTPLPTLNSFAAFIHYAETSRGSVSKYWRKTLHGSHIARISDSRAFSVAKPKNDDDLKPIFCETIIEIPPLPPTVTLAVAMSSALAVAVAEWTGETDIVFGSVVTGRNSSFPGVQYVAGPCVNIIPLRANIHSNQTPTKLFSSLHEQYHMLGKADTFGLLDIIKHSTDWPPDSRFEFIYQHQNVDENPEFEFGDSKIKLKWFENPFFIPPNFSIVSYAEGQALRVKILTNSQFMCEDTAKSVLKYLKDLVPSLLLLPERPLSTGNFHKFSFVAS